MIKYVTVVERKKKKRRYDKASSEEADQSANLEIFAV